MPLTPEQAEVLLSADEGNLAQKVAKGRTLSLSERARLEQLRTGGKADAGAYLKKSDLARTLGCSRQRLQYHTRQSGFPKPDDSGRYKTADVLAYARRAGLPTPSPRTGAAGEASAKNPLFPGRGEGVPSSASTPSLQDSNPDDVDLYRERALLTRAQRIGVETDNAKSAGVLLEATAVDQAWEMIRSNVRQKILAMPAKIESQSHLEPEQRVKLRKLLDREIDDVLTELAKPPDYQLAATAAEGAAPEETA